MFLKKCLSGSDSIVILIMLSNLAVASAYVIILNAKKEKKNKEENANIYQYHNTVYWVLPYYYSYLHFFFSDKHVTKTHLAYNCI